MPQGNLPIKLSPSWASIKLTPTLSGGFVAPFVKPDLEWDFRLEKVVSINVSGHKYGLVSWNHLPP